MSASTVAEGRDAGLVLIDFDGTLAHRQGLWSGCAIEVLDERLPGHGIDVERIRELMHGAYPWNRPEEAHPELSEPGRWWAAVEARLTDAFHGAGAPRGEGAALARAVRERFLDPAVGWRLFDDTLDAVRKLRDGGWRTAILSNHVPELPELARSLGLGGLFEAVFTSAATGYEKPHAEAFGVALRACGSPESVWMVGDNPVADVAGAEALGIPAIQVRAALTGKPRGKGRQAADLLQAAEIVLGGSPGHVLRK